MEINSKLVANGRFNKEVVDEIISENKKLSIEERIEQIERTIEELKFDHFTKDHKWEEVWERWVSK
jgi:hypothetical protein